MELIKPERLRRGDTIGIISPASNLDAVGFKCVEQNVKLLKANGYNIKYGKHWKGRYGHTAGTVEQRIEDFNMMFEDDEVKAVLAGRGGYNSNDILDHIDYGMVRKNPKIFCGFSDITFMHCALSTAAGLVSFYGPNASTQMVLPGTDGDYTYRYFDAVVSGTNKTLDIKPSKRYTFQRGKIRKLMPTKWRILKKGKADGRLMGGHVFTVLNLANTRYFPDFKDKILFWEDTEAMTPMTHRFLRQFEMMGVFKQIKGMIIGRVNLDEYKILEKDYGLDKVVMEVTNGYDFPIITDMDFGHTKPMFSTPYGIRASMDCNGSVPKFSLLESAVK